MEIRPCQKAQGAEENGDGHVFLFLLRPVSITCYKAHDHDGRDPGDGTEDAGDHIIRAGHALDDLGQPE